MKASTKTAVKALEILLESPEGLMEAAKAAVGHGEQAKGLLEKYIQLSSMPEWEYATKEKTLFLRPGEITEFFEQSKAYKNHPLYGKALGRFTSKLVQESYRKGENGFVLDAGGISGLKNLCHKVEGSKDKKLKIEVRGNPGEGFCSCAQYSVITLEKPDYSCGIYTTGCDFRVQSKSHAEKIVKELRSGFKCGNGSTRHWCNIHNGSINRVYMIGKDKDELFWSEDCWQFKREMEEFNEREARRRGPDYMEPD